MRIALFATLTLVTGTVQGVCRNSTHSELRHFAFSCRDVARSAQSYLSEHGVSTFEKTRSEDISIVGREPEPVTAGSISNGRRKLRRWEDAQGDEVTDFKVYWTYADTRTVEQPAFGWWRIRLAHYTPSGEIMLASAGDEGCAVDFHLVFGAWGANLPIILPMDSQWGYASNGRLERGYLDGISAVLEQRKANPPNPSQQRP